MEAIKSRIDERNQAIARLQAEQIEDENRLFDEAKKGGFIDMLNNVELESSAYETLEFRAFYRQFKKEFTEILKKELGATKIEIYKGHFHAFGFFQLPNENIWYFSLEDLRWGKAFIVRTAIDFKDYTGGPNDHLNIKSKEAFLISLKQAIH